MNGTIQLERYDAITTRFETMREAGAFSRWSFDSFIKGRAPRLPKQVRRDPSILESALTGLGFRARFGSRQTPPAESASETNPCS
jgi:hypothetical protein